MADDPRGSAACEWCGRAVAQDAEGRWYAVKGEERGYDPLVCDVAGDGRHSPDQPTSAAGTVVYQVSNGLWYDCCDACRTVHGPWKSEDDARAFGREHDRNAGHTEATDGT